MSGLLVKSRKKILDGDIDLLVDTVKASIYDVADLTQAKAITGATNATPIVVTANSHGLSNGDFVTIHGVAGNTAANGHFKVANVTTNTFELTDPVTGANVAGSGSYTSGGYVISLEAIEFLSDVAGGGIVATSSGLANKSTTRGIFDADDAVLSSVTGDACEIVLLYKDTGSSATSPIIAIIDSFSSGMPVTPNGGSITLSWAASGIFQLI